MIGVLVNFVSHLDRVAEATLKARRRLLKRGAFLVYEDSKASIKDEPGPSPAGQPPHTHTSGVTKAGKLRLGFLPRAIVYDAQDEDAVIGPRFSIVGLSGEAHEKGDVFHGQDFPERAYMEPALERQAPAWFQSFAGSVV